MADIKAQKYKDPRPPEAFADFHAYARTHDPNWAYDFVRMVTTPISLFIYRAAQIGVDNVPASGPVILAANHFSNFDHFLAGAWLRRKIRFLAKSQLFGKPGVRGWMDYIYEKGGVFPVRRGHGDEEAFTTIDAICDLGGCIMIYVEGGRSRSGELGRARPGVGRAALKTGVPVVPIALHGSQGIRRWRRLVFPKVTVRYGEPIVFDVVETPSRDEQLAVSEEIFTIVREMYEELDRDGRRVVGRRVRAEERAAGPGRPSYS